MSSHSQRKSNSEVIPAPGIEPHDLRFVLNWASQAERGHIFKTMKDNGRQTMNLRIMPTAKLILLKSVSRGGAIAGWGGLDFEHNPKFPEVFSQFVFPQYRTYLLGLALIHIRALLLQENGFKTGYFRMEAESNAELFAMRTSSGLYRAIPDAEVDQNWKNNCTNCELYKVSCMKQAYLKFDVDQVVEFGTRRLGMTATAHFPKELILREEQFRKDEKFVYKAHWAA